MIGAALDKRPACCRLPQEELLRIYAACGIGKHKVCNACQQVKLGAPLKTASRDWGHVCFECIITRFVRSN